MNCPDRGIVLRRCLPARTSVQICYTQEYLRLIYIAKDDTYLKNTYMQCNSETYNQEVVEVFVAPQANDSINYHEVCAIA